MPLSRLDLALLGEDERIRAPRFRRQEDRVLLLRRGRRSTLLALRVNARPEKLDFIANQHGKPRLSEDLAIELKVLHAGRFAPIALSPLDRCSPRTPDCFGRFRATLKGL